MVAGFGADSATTVTLNEGVADKQAAGTRTTAEMVSEKDKIGSVEHPES